MSGSQLIGHNGEIAGIAFSADGSKAVSGAHTSQRPGEAILWNLLSGTAHRHLRGHKAGVFSIACSPDNKSIATGGGGAVQGNRWVYDHAIRLWNDQGDQVLRFGEDLFFVYALAYSPDARFLLSGSGIHPKSDGSCLRLWQAGAGKELRRFGHHSYPVRAVAFSPDGDAIVAAGGGLKAGGYLPGKATIKTSALESQTIRVWETNSGQELNMFSYREWVNSIAFSPDGRQLLSAGKGLLLWDFVSGGQYRRLGGTETEFVHHAIFSPNGRSIAAGTGGRREMGSPYQNCCTRLYDRATGVESACWVHDYPVKALAFSPDGRQLLAGGERGELRRWDVTV